MPCIGGRVFQKGDPQQRYHGCSQLSEHCVFTGAHKELNAPIVFDELEEHLYMPALLINLRHGGCSPGKGIGHKRDTPAGLEGQSR